MGPQEDYIETVFTCEGDFDDPHLQDRLDDFQSSLKDLLLTDKNKLILKKVEPWNSVRVTFNIPREAAVRLKQLAQQGNTTLRDLGVLAVQILDQHISLTIAGRNNERTQLVFKTAEPTAGASLSVFDSQSPSLDVLRPPGPGPSNVEATRKNIQEYLKQGSSLIDSLFGQADGDKVRPTGELASRPNNIYPGHQGEAFHSTNPATTSPSINAHSPSRSPGGSSSLKFLQPPGLPPGMPPGLPFGSGNSLAGLPPPPPYPHGSSYMNNLQKLRFGSTSASPLLVNLLQNDPGLSSFLATGKIPQSLDPDALPPPKKKRKPRKPREKKPKPGSEGEVPIKSVPNPVLSSSVSQHSSSSPMYTQSVSMSRSETSCHNREMSSVESVKDHNLQHPQAMHNISVQNVRDDRVPLTCQQSSFNKPETEQDTAGKIINPVTGLLEPIENLSDTSPEKVSPKSFGPRMTTGKAGDIISNLITTHIRIDNQGNNNRGNQRTFSELSPHAAIGHVSQRPESSQFGGSTTSDSVEQKQMRIRQEFINMIHKEKPKDVKKAEKSGQHVLPQKLKEHPQVSDVKQTVPSVGQVPKVEKVSLPQESDVKSIPSQLLNKPLLEVKHNSVSKPTGSPDSNGDSECSSQGISVEPHLAQDSPSVTTVSHIDPHLKSYNNDSGVGSSSERSEDPSEPGDNDYKGSHSSNNSFDCAKSQLVDPIKQAPPNSKVMTVGYTTMTDLPRDLKNHKIPSPFYKTNALVNSKLDPATLKRDVFINDQTVYNKRLNDHYHMMNSMETTKSTVVSETVNRKSPKLAASSPKPSAPGQDGQGNPENPPMQKKKYSPRNSPRGSPRPKGSSSPRNSGSPRASDHTAGVGGSRMPFLGAQEFVSHLPGRSESHMVIQRNEPARSPYNEQRKSPFSQSSVPYSSPSLSRAHFAGLPGVDVENRRDLLHSSGVDMAQISPQCNNDNMAMFKSSEPYHHSHAQHRLSALAGTKDPMILQRKLEELRPIFQQLQQQAAQAQLAVPSATNGTDQPNSPSRSPVGSLPKGQNPTSVELQSAFDIAAVRSNVHHSVASTNAAFLNDNSVNCTKVSKISDEQKGTNVVSGTRRPSPGVANPFPYASSLPLPKRLTESVQKLVKPLPLDNSLPHQKSRSPSSSASTKQVSSNNNSVPKASVRGSTSGNKTPVNDASHLDIDLITPSITGFCFEGQLDLMHPLPQLSSPSLNEELGPPPLQLTDSMLSAGTFIDSVSQASTTLVPAVTSSILSHKTYSGDSASNSAFLPSNKLPGGGVISNSVPSAIPSANVSTTASLCNSDVKMANLSAKERTVNVKPSVGSSGLGPPILHPYNARYPVLKHEEKPKSPYQQMGLSEMLQETANLHSISADRLQFQNTSVSQRNISHSQLNVTSSSQEIHSSAIDETTDLSIPVLSRQNSNPSVSKLVNCDSSVSISDISSSEIPSISKIASMKSCENTNTTNALHQPVPNVLGSKQTGSIAKEDVKPMIKPESGPVAERNNVSVSCEISTSVAAEKTGLQALGSVESEASQSKQDLSDGEQIYKECDNVKVDKTDCDKVSVPAVMTSADVLKSNLSSSCNAIKAARTTTPHDSLLHGDKENITSDLPENLESDVSKNTKVKTRPHVPAEELNEDKSTNDLDTAPRQLRSRKRTNTGESDSSNPSEEPCKKPKLEIKSETSSKVDSKVTAVSKMSNSSAVSSSNEMKNSDDSNTQTLIDTVKSGLRARTNVKTVHSEDKEKTKTVVGKETRKDTKAVAKSVPEKKVEPPPKPEEIRRNSQSRRSRQSPSNLVEKPQNTVGTRDKSPVRSRTRGRNSPVVVEQQEDSQENKRTTRSAKTKAEPQPVEPAAVNKRRRTSRDHR